MRVEMEGVLGELTQAGCVTLLCMNVYICVCLSGRGGAGGVIWVCVWGGGRWRGCWGISRRRDKGFGLIRMCVHGFTCT